MVVHHFFARARSVAGFSVGHCRKLRPPHRTAELPSPPPASRRRRRDARRVPLSQCQDQLAWLCRGRETWIWFHRQRRETAAARHKGPDKTSDKASATSLAPAVREKSASGRALRAHASCAGASARKTGQRAPVLVFGAESGPRRPVFWVRSAGRIRPEEQGPPRGGSGAARALPGAPRPAASTLRLSVLQRVLPRVRLPAN